MRFRTEIPVTKHTSSLQHGQPVLSLGSCFAEHIVGKLLASKFQVVNNPFGTTYNPLSLADQLQAIANHRSYNVADLEKHRGQWLSFDHHGSFTRAHSKDAVDAIQDALEKGQSFNGNYRWTIISLGTAWAWFKDEKVVNNCHKLPESTFDFRVLEIDEMYRALDGALAKWTEKNPDVEILMTVSPVRHTRSGLIDNNRSKARLLELAHLLVEGRDNAYYYPSYELIVDDLRDYRFYDSSLTHPSPQAVEYVWEHFQASFFSNQTLDTLSAFESFRSSLFHRPRQTSGPAFDGHLQSLEKKFSAWVQRWPDADWTEEKLRWNELMKMS